MGMTKKAVPKSVTIAAVNDDTFCAAMNSTANEVQITPSRLVSLTRLFTDINELRRHVAARVTLYDDSSIYDPTAAWKRTYVSQDMPTPRPTVCHRLFWLLGDDGTIVRPLADVVDFSTLRALSSIDAVDFTTEVDTKADKWHVRMRRSRSTRGLVVSPSFPSKKALASFLESLRYVYRAAIEQRNVGAAAVLFEVYDGANFKGDVYGVYHKLDDDKRKRKAAEELKELTARAFPSTSWEEAMTVPEPLPPPKAVVPEPAPAPPPVNKEPTTREMLADMMGTSEQLREERARATYGTGDRMQNIVDALPDSYAWTNAPWPGSADWAAQEALEQTSRSFRNKR